MIKVKGGEVCIDGKLSGDELDWFLTQAIKDQKEGYRYW
jgi:hypothetical protein